VKSVQLPEQTTLEVGCNQKLLRELREVL
jgi:hypothetical protein